MHKTIATTYKTYHVQLFWALVSFLVLSVLAYAYFVNATIFHTAQRQHLEDAIIESKSAVSELELAVIETSRNVTRTYAQALGFVDATTLVFVERDTNVSLSLHEIER